MSDKHDTEPATEPDPRSPYEEVLDELRAIHGKLDEVLREQKAVRGHVDELLGTRRGELRRVTEIERRLDEHDELHAEAAYAGANGAVG